MWLALRGQCNLGLFMAEDSKYGWTCHVQVFISHVIRLEGQGAARFEWSLCAWGSVGYLKVQLEGLSRE